MSEPNTTSGWFTVEAGALIRGQVRREIESAAWNRGLDIDALLAMTAEGAEQ